MTTASVRRQRVTTAIALLVLVTACCWWAALIQWRRADDRTRFHNQVQILADYEGWHSEPLTAPDHSASLLLITVGATAAAVAVACAVAREART